MQKVTLQPDGAGPTEAPASETVIERAPTVAEVFAAAPPVPKAVAEAITNLAEADPVTLEMGAVLETLAAAPPQPANVAEALAVAAENEPETIVVNVPEAVEPIAQALAAMPSAPQEVADAIEILAAAPALSPDVAHAIAQVAQAEPVRDTVAFSLGQIAASPAAKPLEATVQQAVEALAVEPMVDRKTADAIQALAEAPAVDEATARTLEALAREEPQSLQFASIPEEVKGAAELLAASPAQPEGVAEAVGALARAEPVPEKQASLLAIVAMSDPQAPSDAEIFLTRQSPPAQPEASEKPEPVAEPVAESPKDKAFWKAEVERFGKAISEGETRAGELRAAIAALQAQIVELEKQLEQHEADINLARNQEDAAESAIAELEALEAKAAQEEELKAAPPALLPGEIAVTPSTNPGFVLVWTGTAEGAVSQEAPFLL